MTELAELIVGSAPEPWARIGLRPHNGAVRIGAVALRLDPAAQGIGGWGLAGWPDPAGVPSDLDGLPTYAAPAATDPPEPNELGASRLELVSIATSSIQRTAEAIAQATGEPLKGLRESDAFAVGYIRLGEVLAEIVRSGSAEPGRARFGGLIIVVEDLAEVSARLGPDVISEVRIAVQYGRYIATFRPGVGLGLPVAAMTPPPPAPPTSEQLAQWHERRLAVRGAL